MNNTYDIKIIKNDISNINEKTLDNYISFIKKNLKIDIYEIRYIILLTLKNNVLCLNDNNYFKKIFMEKYYKNYNFLIKHIKIPKRNFKSLCNNINMHKKRAYAYFETIDNNNVSFYVPIIEKLEDIN